MSFLISLSLYENDMEGQRTSKILVTDDEPDLELVISQKFRSRIKSGELHFTFAENGAVALEKLKADPEIELVFTDINMPVMDGLTLLGKIKEHNLHAKAVVISAYGDVKNIRTAMNRGAFDFIIKPIDLEDLEATLTKAIREMEILRQGLEAKSRLEVALLEKAEAQQQALINLQEKEKLILQQNEMLEKQVEERTAEINRQKDLIAEKNTEILQSIHYAKRLQEAILPSRKALEKNFPESFILYYPKDIVAGDFYWIEEGEEILVVAADCTGHGVAGALMSMLGISLLNQIVKQNHITSPSLILDQLHRSIVQALNQDNNDTNDGMDIAICSFKKDMRTVSYAGANRPLWMVRNENLVIHLPDKMPIGGMQFSERNPFTNHVIRLEKGDRLYLFTDGYADQFGGDAGRKLMTKNLKELIHSTPPLPIKIQEKKLHDYFYSWKGSQEQVDDVLVMGLEISR